MFFLGEITSSQALLLIRCCGNLVIEEAPQKRTELAAKVMSTLKELSKFQNLLLLKQISRQNYSFS